VQREKRTLPLVTTLGHSAFEWIQGTGKTGPYLLPYLLIPPFRGLVPTSRPVEENSSQCAYQLLIDLQIPYLDRIRAIEPPSYCLFLLLAYRRWALTRPVLIAIYWCSRHRKSRRLLTKRHGRKQRWTGLREKKIWIWGCVLKTKVPSLLILLRNVDFQAKFQDKVLSQSSKRGPVSVPAAAGDEVAASRIISTPSWTETPMNDKYQQLRNLIPTPTKVIYYYPILV